MTDYEWLLKTKKELAERMAFSGDVEYAYQQKLMKSLNEYIAAVEELRSLE